MRRLFTRLGALAWVLTCYSTMAAAQLRSDVYVSGLNLPVAFVQDPSQSNVQFVVEQFGQIRVIQNGTLLGTSFLDLSAAVSAGGERGLLGLAFDPAYATNRRFYVNFTNTSGHTVIARFTRSAGNAILADPASRFDFVFPSASGPHPYIEQPFGNHNGGDLHFGPDGHLYVGLGDGGSGNDPMNLAQDMDQLLGKMLRLDVSVGDSDLSGYRPPTDNPFYEPFTTTGIAGAFPIRSLMWSLGWRNPWRFTFDDPAVGGRGAMIVADVGQNAWEEASYEPAGRGGRNYGWRIREGAHPNPAFGDPTTAGLTDPVIEYSHAVGNAITGGPVNHGSSLGLSNFGRYFFADLNGRVWSAGLTIDSTTGEATNADITEHTSDIGNVGTPVAFGRDAACRIYIVDYSGGRILRILPASMSTDSVCATPDPFLALGGGVWLGNGWVPPDHPGAGTPTPSPTPTPVPTPSPGTCPSAAPALDWVCVGGGWVPPGHPLAGGTPPPSPTPPDPPAPTPGACTTTAPASGWVCVKGGWVPPGHPLAIGVPPTPTPPAPPPAGCTGPDPFIGIPGLSGVCVNGGWVPAGHPLAKGR